MKFSSLLLSAAALSHSVFAVPHAEAQGAENVLEPRQSGYLPVTGPSGDVQQRLEIRQLYWNRPNQWTLLILALQKYQQMSQDDKLSYYQISGIHGVPRQDWDGVGQCSSCNGADGYCPHDSILFPAWHRVYVALFEQQFLKIVNDVVNTFSGDRLATMQRAAASLRFPYWDWAANPRQGYPAFPTIIASKYVTINGPNGQQTIINPLFRFDFKDNSKLVYFPFSSNWKYTFRYPTSNANSATSTEQSASTAFENIRGSLQDQVFQMFSTCTDYEHFSNDAASSSSNRCSNSLEGIHNTVHTTAGGAGTSSITGGHMTYLPTAAFDPIFWLHHTNVDRIFALWQAVNPNSYGGSQVAPHNTWTIAQGSNQDANSPLTPMHKDTAGNFYSTNDVKDWTQFKYTYPEFANSDGSSNAINSYINKLYGPSATATAGSSKRTPGPDPHLHAHIHRDPTVGLVDDLLDGVPIIELPKSQLPKSLLPSVSLPSVALPTGSKVLPTGKLPVPTGKLPIPTGTSVPFSNLTGVVSNLTASLTNPLRSQNGSLFQYVANIKTPRYALDGSYTIYLFHGQPESEDTSSWIYDSNLIGPYGVLGQPGASHMNVTVAASIPLTRVLTHAVANGLLRDLSEALVVPYLQAHLIWRIVGPKGEEVKADSLPGFNINVYGSTVNLPSNPSELPKYSDFVHLEDATKDLPICGCPSES